MTTDQQPGTVVSQADLSRALTVAQAFLSPKYPLPVQIVLGDPVLVVAGSRIQVAAMTVRAIEQDPAGEAPAFWVSTHDAKNIARVFPKPGREGEDSAAVRIEVRGPEVIFTDASGLLDGVSLTCGLTEGSPLLSVVRRAIDARPYRPADDTWALLDVTGRALATAAKAFESPISILTTPTKDGHPSPHIATIHDKLAAIFMPAHLDTDEQPLADPFAALEHWEGIIPASVDARTPESLGDEEPDEPDEDAPIDGQTEIDLGQAS